MNGLKLWINLALMLGILNSQTVSSETRYYPIGQSEIIEVDKENYLPSYMSLRNLEGVYLDLSGVIDGATKVGLTLRSDLTSQVKNRLQNAGLKLFTEDEVEDIPGQPELAIYPSYANELGQLINTPITNKAISKVSTALGDEYHCCLSKTWASFSQSGTILSNPTLNFRMATWGFGGENWSCKNTGKWMENIVLETLDAFILDYKKAMSQETLSTLNVKQPKDIPNACHQQWALTLTAFNIDSTSINDTVKPIFKQMAVSAQKCPDYRYIIEAHSDTRASSEYNEKLSMTRAQAVKLFLIKNGLNADRLETLNYGERKPLVEGNSSKTHGMSRRIIISPIKHL